MNTITDAFRAAVANWLKQTDTDVENLGLMVKCHPNTLQKWLTRNTENIPLERAFKIAKIIGYEFEV